MAYALCLWDTARHAPLPNDADDALAMMERLSGTPDSWNPTVIGFATELMARAGTAPGAGSGMGGAEAFWGGDLHQAATDCTTAVFRVTLPGDDDTCLPQIGLVVEAAARCGLVVYDDENGMCFLPDGRIFPEDAREMWTANLAEALAGPIDPSTVPPDNRTFAQTLLSELFDAIGRGNRRIF